jgi:hypothetical protein
MLRRRLTRSGPDRVADSALVAERRVVDGSIHTSVVDASLPDTFFRMAKAVLDGNPQISHQWSSGHRGKRTLSIPKADDRGFDVTIECETYGLYPFADGWHGAPWDINTPKMSVEEICQDCLGFVRSLLCADAKLTVHYSNNRPFRWVLTYPFGGRPVSDRAGLFLFNYFGRRTTGEFQNHHLPRREAEQKA